MAQTVTLWELKTSMYGLMNDTSTNTTYTTWNRDIDKINDVCRRITDWYIPSLTVQWKFYKCKDMLFMRDRQLVEFKDYVKCSADVLEWADTINIDTTNFDNSWAIYSQWMVINYTSKSVTQLLGCSWVFSNFDSWTSFCQIYAVNANLDKVYRMFKLTDNQEVEITEVKQDDDKFWRQKIKSFTLVRDEETETQYILLRWFSNGDKFLFKYYKQYVDMVEDTDICMIPKVYAKAIVPFISWWELLMESESETNERVNKLNWWYAALHWMYTKYNRMSKDPKPMVQFANQRSQFSWVPNWYTRTWFRVF